MDYNKNPKSPAQEARQDDNRITRRPINEPRPQEEQEGQCLNKIHVDSKFEAYTVLMSAPKEERKEMEEYFTQ